MKFSVVMPISKDRDFLFFSLPTVFRLNPNEIILLFDSEEEIDVARKICRRFGFEDKTSFIDLMKIPSPDWRCRIAFARRYGFDLACNNVVLNTDADTILDPHIENYSRKIGKNKFSLISFERKNPINIREVLIRAREKIVPVKGKVSAIYMFDRSAWLETEDINDLKKYPILEDSHLHRAFWKKGFRTLYVNTNCFHLRSIKDTPQINYLRGLIYANRDISLSRMLIRSFIQLNPSMLVGFLHAKKLRPFRYRT